MAVTGLVAGAKPTAPVVRNPISASFADTYADPAVIEGKDGWWYAYATADPLRAGDPPGIMHVARTRDFRSWDYRGTVFNENNRPRFATATAGLWAPDVRYIDGRYVMYYTVTDTTLNEGDDAAIGAATAPTPTGPWTPVDSPVVPPRAAPGGGFWWTFDPSGFTDVTGQRYLYFGSYFGGLWVSEMSADGLTTTGTPTQVAVDNRYEGSYVVRHGDWYYLMASAANCCAGPTTGYSVFAGRSQSPLGPFVDADGISLLASRVGGTVVVTQNGNRWIGAGHHAVATDHAGRDFLVYHALDRNVPWLTEPFGINRRPMLIDRLDWVDGWPRVRAGAGPSEGPQPGPVTGFDLGIVPDNPVRGFVGLAAGPVDPQAGETGEVDGQAHTRQALREDAYRLRLDLRGSQPLTVILGDDGRRSRSQISVRVDSDRGELVVRTEDGRKSRTERVPIPPITAGWQTLVVEVSKGQVHVQLSEDDLNDPYAEARLRLSGRTLGSAPIRLQGRDVLVDNVSVRPLARDARRLVAEPTAGRLLDADEFRRELDGRWTWVRGNPDATVADGRLNWPVEGSDLVGANNTAGVLLRDPPAGNWIAETKVTLPLGTDEVRNFQQAGLVAYQSDDDFARLSTVAIWNTRQTEFGRELVATGDGRTSFGGALIGTPAETVWLRMAHTRNAAGEHVYRAGTSRDGRDWTWGAAWTFPASATPRIGLVAHGGAEPAVSAAFDYLRFYRLR